LAAFPSSSFMLLRSSSSRMAGASSSTDSQSLSSLFSSAFFKFAFIIRSPLILVFSASEALDFPASVFLLAALTFLCSPLTTVWP
jgi:hypothetical protein